MTPEPGFVAETLAWCNEIRAEKGMEPLDKLPKGRRRHGDSCPCGRATGTYVGNLYYTDAGKRASLSLPVSVAKFVRAFDGGALPQYDEAVA